MSDKARVERELEELRQTLIDTGCAHHALWIDDALSHIRTAKAKPTPDPAYTAYLASLTERECECCGERFTPKRNPHARLCPVCAVEFRPSDLSGFEFDTRRRYLLETAGRDGDGGVAFIDLAAKRSYANRAEIVAALGVEE